MKSQSPDETAFIYHMIGSNGNNGENTNISDEDEAPITNPRARILPTPENPRGYPPFDLRLVPNYINN